MYFPNDRDVAALWGSVASALAAATYVVGGFMVLLLLLIAVVELRARRLAANTGATAAPERD